MKPLSPNAKRAIAGTALAAAIAAAAAGRAVDCSKAAILDRAADNAAAELRCTAEACVAEVHAAWIEIEGKCK